MIPGRPYSIIAALETGRTSWTQWQPGDRDIFIVLDAGYEAPRIAWLLRDLPVEILGRTRSDRVLPRPWERPMAPVRLTPARVRRGSRNLRVTSPSPARAPESSRPGPGRPPGSRNRHTATCHDVGLILVTGHAHQRPTHHKKGTKPRRTG